MFSNVIKSDRAEDLNIIMRTFVPLREMIAPHGL